MQVTDDDQAPIPYGFANHPFLAVAMGLLAGYLLARVLDR